jgi:hypothetical protein
MDNIVLPPTQATISPSHWNMGTYVLIIVILAFLGFNIFAALGSFTNTTVGIFGPLLSKIGYGVGETIKTTADVSAKGIKLGADVSAKGIKLGADVASGTVDSAVTILEQSVGASKIQLNQIDNVTTNKALASAVLKNKNINIPTPDDSSSSTQTMHKSGYCYIGEDRGVRSCLQVNESDTCMSGNIFPTQDICINPSLRE